MPTFRDNKQALYGKGHVEFKQKTALYSGGQV